MLSKNYLQNKMFYNFIELMGAFGSAQAAQEMIDRDYVIEIDDNVFMFTHTMLEGLNVSFTSRLRMIKEQFLIAADWDYIGVFIGNHFNGADGQWLSLPLDEEVLDAISTALDDYLIADVDGASANNSLEDLNSIAEEIDAMSDSWESNQLLAAFEDTGSASEAIETYEEYHHLCDYEYQINGALVDDYLEAFYEVQAMIDKSHYLMLDTEGIANDMRAEGSIVKVEDGFYYRQ